MRFKSQQKTSQMPEINLVPMMDVILTILTFFIVVSMTLTTQQGAVDLTLPSTDSGTSQQNTPDPLVISLNQKGQLFLGSQTVSETQLAQPIQAYLQKNPQGAVILKADKNLPYEKVVKLLGTMRDIGGDRVSLAIDN
ncbi:MAG TPA: biopolymer transporter ExbD [Coleofasciculaceae cyanobacterium]